MWTEIAVIAGAGVVALGGIVIKMQNNKIKDNSNDLDGKTDKEMCDQRYGELIIDMKRGDKRFDTIDKTLDKHGKLLVKIDTTLDLLNGRE